MRQTREQIQSGQSRSQHQHISGLREFGTRFAGPSINQVAIALVKRSILERRIAWRKIPECENYLIGPERRTSREFDVKGTIKKRYQIDRFGGNFSQTGL